MGPLAAVVGVVGALASAAGTVVSGISQANAANYNAQVAKNNAIIATQMATQASAAGQANAEKEGQQESAIIGEAKTAEAANNVDVNTGSAATNLIGEREVGLLNTQQVLQKAELEAYGYKAQATGFEAQASLDKYEASTAPFGAAIGAVGGLAGNPFISGSTAGSTGLLGGASPISTAWSGGGAGAVVPSTSDTGGIGMA